MSTLLVCFAVSLALALFLTPIVRARATRLGILDYPGGRRVHSQPTPRAGGIAVFLAFLPVFVTGVAIQYFLGQTSLPRSEAVGGLILGATLVFLVGLVDDVNGLKPRTKLFIQAIAATIAWAGGVRIASVGLPFLGPVELGILSLPATIFWFLLLVNAINLIDGLDGLAAGIVFFACITLLAVFTASANLGVAIGLAALAGATLGFLRYNFNPASIFLGDSGAYFLGFAFAGLTALGSIKTPAAVGLLVPVIALGVPLIDVLWSPIRRFLLGRKLFAADMDHIHHRLVSMGWTTRDAVLMLYGLTLLMGFGAVLLMHTREERNLLVLVLIGAGAILVIRKLGYFDFIRAQNVRRWLGAIADEIGLAHTRRAFLARQLELQAAATLDEVDRALQAAAKQLGLLSLQVELGSGIAGGGGRRLSIGSLPPSGWDHTRHILVSMPLATDVPDAGHLTAIVSMNDTDEQTNVARRLDGIRRGLLSSRYALSHEFKVREADAFESAGAA